LKRMRRNRHNCRLRLGLADRARGRGIAAGRYYNSRIAKLFPKFSGDSQEIDQVKVNAQGFLFSVQSRHPEGNCSEVGRPIGCINPPLSCSVARRARHGCRLPPRLSGREGRGTSEGGMDPLQRAQSAKKVAIWLIASWAEQHSVQRIALG
jgi:hypothetical protein